MTFEVFHRPRPRRTPQQRPRPTARDRTIRAAHQAGVSRAELATLFGLTHGRVCQIINEQEQHHDG